jgi:hypothetical protein
MTSHQHRSRVPAGVTTGGQFATESRSEAQVSLTERPSYADVLVDGSQGPNSATYAAALSKVTPLRDVLLKVHIDEPGGRFSATAYAQGFDYRIDSSDGKNVCLRRSDGAHLGDQWGRIDALDYELPRMVAAAHVAVHERDTVKNVERMVREEFSSELIKRHVAAVRRGHDLDSIEVGIPLAGDHMKIVTFDASSTGTGTDAVAEGRLFARSPIKDDQLAELTDRQNTNRLNKALDAIGPDREYSERYLRRYMALARAELDARRAADPVWSETER